MSGSGSAVFGLYESRQAAGRAAREAAGLGRVMVATTLNRRRYQRLAAAGLPRTRPIDYT
jgi:4-diphosphocytidyl-2C-methyl-D-erythritol kinase